MSLTWELCDLQQNVLATLDDRRPGGRVELSLNATRRASVAISLEDPAAALATSMLTALRCKVDGWADPLFCGRVLIPETRRAEDREELTLNAVGPLGFLEHAYVWVLATVLGEQRILGVEFNEDQSSIMWRLIDVFANGNDTLPLGTPLPGDHRFGIREGTLAAASISRLMMYPPGKQLGEALSELAQIDGGPDFEEQPVEATDGTLAEFSTFYPKLGSDLSGSVRFEHGKGDQTALSFEMAPAGDELVNWFMGITPQDDENVFPSLYAWDQDSIDLYGIFEANEAFSDPNIAADGSTLSAYAKAVVAAGAYPDPFFDFTPAPDAFEFAPGGDFWMGDTIGVDARMPDGEEVSVEGRVTDAALVEQENGELAPDLTCTASIDSGAVQTASEIIVPLYNPAS